MSKGKKVASRAPCERLIMTDTERLEWIATHVHQIQVGTKTDPVMINWFDDDGASWKKQGPKTDSWVNGLRAVIDEIMFSSLPNARHYGAEFARLP